MLGGSDKAPPNSDIRLGSFASKMADRFRQQRHINLRKLISGLAAQQSRPFRIVDLGGRFDYWQQVGVDFLNEHNVTVICINHLESELSLTNGLHWRITAEVGDACALTNHGDLSFSMVHSNSSIEHVGDYARKTAFANEVRRLAPAYYVQTPYFWFPIDPHWPRAPFFHWMPMSWRYRLMMLFKLGWAGPYKSISHAIADLESTTLIDWRQAKDLFPDANLRAERMLILPKSIIAWRLTHNPKA